MAQGVHRVKSEGNSGSGGRVLSQSCKAERTQMSAHIQAPQLYGGRRPAENGEKIPFGVTKGSGAQVMSEEAVHSSRAPSTHSILCCSPYLGSERLSYCLCHEQVSDGAPKPASPSGKLTRPFLCALGLPILLHTLHLLSTPC